MMDPFRQFMNNLCLELTVPEIHQRLDEHPDWLNRTDHTGTTLLSRAIRARATEIAQLLLDRGSQAATIADNSGYYPIHWAAWSGVFPALQLIVDWLDAHVGSEVVKQQLLLPGSNGRLSLVSAIMMKREEQAVYLLNLQPDALLLTTRSDIIAYDSEMRGPFLAVLRLGFAKLDQDRLRSWLTANEHDMFGAIFTHASDDIVNAMLEIVPLQSALIKNDYLNVNANNVHRLLHYRHSIDFDPFFRGRVYERLIHTNKGLIYRFVGDGVTAEVMSSAILLINDICGYGLAYESFHMPTTHSIQLFRVNSIELAEFFVGIGWDFEKSLSEDANHEARHRIYFRHSLLWRLIHAI